MILDSNEPYYILRWIYFYYTDSMAPGIVEEHDHRTFTSVSLAREFYNKKKRDRSCKEFELYYIQSEKMDL